MDRQTDGHTDTATQHNTHTHLVYTLHSLVLGVWTPDVLACEKVFRELLLQHHGTERAVGAGRGCKLTLHLVLPGRGGGAGVTLQGHWKYSIQAPLSMPLHYSPRHCTQQYSPRHCTQQESTHWRGATTVDSNVLGLITHMYTHMHTLAVTHCLWCILTTTGQPLEATSYSSGMSGLGWQP